MERKEAMKILKDFHDKSALFSVRTALDTIIPELKESEDEKIRKKLLNFFSDEGEWLSGTTFAEVRAWLEKQGEQKPAWSKEDEGFLNIAINILNSSKVYTKSPNKYEETINWLKLFKDRVQPKQEWSENDEKILNSLISSLARIGASTRTDSTSINYTFSKEIDWLKSLRPQNRWKPSDEQMDALRYVTNFDYGGHKATLVSLYEQLKKLKG